MYKYNLHIWKALNTNSKRLRGLLHVGEHHVNLTYSNVNIAYTNKQ